MISTNKLNYTKLLNYLFIAYAFAVPISKAGTNIFETLIFIFWIMEGRWEEKFSLIKTNLLSISILLLIVVSILYIPLSSNTQFALNYIGKYRHFLIILVMLTSLKKEYFNTILSAFIMGMLISEIMSYGIFFEIIHYKDKLPSDPAPFMDHISYSSFLSFTSILLLVKIYSSSSLKEKIFYILFFVTLTINLFINGGRTGQVTFIAILIISFFILTKSKLKAFLISAILISTIIIGAYNFSPNFLTRVNALNLEIESMINNNNYTGSISGRAALWIVGIDKLKDNLLIGSGIGNDMQDIKKYIENRGFDYQYLKTFSDHHNVYLTMSIQYGFLGIIFLVLLLYSLFTLKFQTVEYKVLNIAFSTSFFLWSFTGMTLHNMNPMTFFTLFAGIFNAMSYLESKQTEI